MRLQRHDRRVLLLLAGALALTLTGGIGLQQREQRLQEERETLRQRVDLVHAAIARRAAALYEGRRYMEQQHGVLLPRSAEEVELQNIHEQLQAVRRELAQANHKRLQEVALELERLEAFRATTQEVRP